MLYARSTDIVRSGYVLHEKLKIAMVNIFSYMLSREYWVVRNQYSRLSFTREDRLCANLYMQEQYTIMMPQC